MFVYLLSILIVLITSYCLYKYHKQWKHIDKLPGPMALPIIGNAHYLGYNPVDNLKKFLKLWYDYDQKIYRVWIGQDPFVVITEPKDMEVVLSSNVLIKKAKTYELFYPWLGDGLLISTGAKWFSHRKMITPSFHFKILVDFHEIIKERSGKFIESLAGKAKTKEIFDIQEVIHYTTLDVICETAMGIQINASENHDSELVRATQDLCYVIQNRIFNPLMQFKVLFPFYKEYTMQKKALNILRTFSMDVIEKRRDLIVSEENAKLKTEETHDETDVIGKRKQAFLDTLLTSTIDGIPLTNQEIYEEVQTFMFEGHDTTSSGITFAAFLLSRHPEIQEKVFKEQQLLFGDNLKSVDPSYIDIQNMKYLDLVIKETQRIYPSVPFVARDVTQDTEINGKLMPKGTTLMLFFFPMGYNEKYFPDPYKFDPERFNSDREKLNPFEYVPFSAGPRNCIGQKFAILEMKSILSHLVRHFKILPPDEECIKVNGDYENLGKFEYDPVLAMVLTLKAEYGVQIRLESRT